MAVTISSPFSGPSILRRGSGPAVASISSSVNTFLAWAGFAFFACLAAAAIDASEDGWSDAAEVACWFDCAAEVSAPMVITAKPNAVSKRKYRKFIRVRDIYKYRAHASAN